MIRFILNFIGFGILFYVIYLFFPEAFHTLVSWADKSYAYLRDLFMDVKGKVHQGESAPPVHQAFMMVALLFKNKIS